MSTTRLSPLDASFLAVESPTAHMHVGWAATFSPPEGRPRPDLRGAVRARSRPPLAGRALPAAAGADAAAPERAPVDRRRRVRCRAAHSSGVVRDAQRGGGRLHVAPARSRPAALATVHRRPARRRPDRSGGQGAPLHGRRDRGGGAGRPAARPDPGADALRGGRLAPRAGAGRAQPALPRSARPGAGRPRPAAPAGARAALAGLRAPPGGERGPSGARGTRHAAPRDARAPRECAAVPVPAPGGRAAAAVGPAADQDRRSTRP